MKQLKKRKLLEGASRGAVLSKAIASAQFTEENIHPVLGGEGKEPTLPINK